MSRFHQEPRFILFFFNFFFLISQLQYYKSHRFYTYVMKCKHPTFITSDRCYYHCHSQVCDLWSCDEGTIPTCPTVTLATPMTLYVEFTSINLLIIDVNLKIFCITKLPIFHCLLAMLGLLTAPLRNYSFSIMMKEPVHKH